MPPIKMQSNSIYRLKLLSTHKLYVVISFKQAVCCPRGYAMISLTIASFNLCTPAMILSVFRT